jgi:hypothetical protein
MKVSSANSYTPRPLADNMALTYNRQKQVAQQNAQSGSQLSVKKEVNAQVAQTIVSIFA